ncbi:dihydroorotate dehydrogenase family protein [Thermodesulfobium narugense DSM 14796]|uniref:Dihydroorotate dehydrogenase n=1 Tax=Thermodesulfobium narugense DSM 14796 TaxID=747365 RepID=M1E6F5_9BACT|nr:dihydroorotate dehydrogenase [Thermodesulfobium narugense]AEE14776.1 dihydroorotate dehydrogenase family protein [Thermodesulfobium narugense DSM 14796]
MSNLKVIFSDVVLENPFIAPSGVFGLGYDVSSDYELKKFGAFTLKTATTKKREGNILPRIVETPAGMLNSIGLQNPGIDEYLKLFPTIKNFFLDCPLIFSISGETVDDFEYLANRVTEIENDVIALELNLSCPNLKSAGVTFSSNVKDSVKVCKKVRKVWKKALIAKLSPLSNFKEMGVSLEGEGIDIFCAINTLPGMRIDINRKKPFLGNIHGGLSGPALLPTSLKCVWDLRRATKLPIIGVGGVYSVESAIEMFMAGANYIGIGSSFYNNPDLLDEISIGIRKFLLENGLKGVEEIVSLAHKTN